MSPSGVGAVAGVGSVVGFFLGAFAGQAIGGRTKRGMRDASLGALAGMVVGAFAGAALTTPTTAAQLSPASP